MPNLPALRPSHLSRELTSHVGDAVLGAVDHVVEGRWEPAQQAAGATIGTVEERVRRAQRDVARQLALTGAVAGGAAAVPGIGLATTASTALAEVGWFTRRASDLVLTIAVIHGHTEATVEQRRGWILSVLAFGQGASTGFTKLAGQAGRGLGGRLTRKVPTEALQSVNRAIGRTIVTKYGTQRGAIALGRALPAGIGAAIGGSANYGFTWAIGRHADRFFRDLPPVLSAIDVESRAADPNPGAG